MTLEQVKALLTLEQYTIFEQLITNHDHRMILIKGVAGSGKTTLISSFIEYLIHDNPDYKIACCATTNQAVKVITNKIKSDSHNIYYSTIHKRLGLKEQIINGEQLFLADYSANTSEHIDYIIVDESSMIGNKKPSRNPKALSLWESIVNYANAHNSIFIFVGDFYQIPPVGEVTCILNKPETILEHNIKVFELNKVVRQAEGSPIIKIATYIREHQDWNLIQYDYKNESNEFGTINIWNKSNQAEILNDIKLLLTDEEYKRDSNFTRTLGWTNETINKLNTVFRRLLYGNEIADKYEYVIGEKLVANKPIVKKEHDTTTVIFTTSDEFKVVAVKSSTMSFEFSQKEYLIKCYLLSVKSSYSDEIQVIPVIHKDSKAFYNTYLNNIKNKAIDSKSDQMWRYYYNIQNRLANVSYAYCMTVHKAQGSTFKHCTVIQNDILLNKRTLERNQILYTAYTRPSQYLNIIK
jgi:exodeoxyribonuclease-5